MMFITKDYIKLIFVNKADGGRTADGVTTPQKYRSILLSPKLNKKKKHTYVVLLSQIILTISDHRQ